ncbi:M14 family zinc carboxypeptidase [Christiangramia sp.]|uniref:M14 family zinc carboxypeptidase n=1 Tax=Christiangramia sp. TaxID=1931228 RepID=UPI00262927C8|nr:M14 family zinc carboxypeptidase [Christiangramia sp.]
MKNNVLKNLFSNQSYEQVKFTDITGRYITNSHLEQVFNEFKNDFEISIPGKSVLGKPIYQFKAGTGNIKVLAWSQMHGNESTTTKAVFDLLNSFKLISNENSISGILENCTLTLIPILNPDGAEAYTRVNANSIDLNRDLQELNQPESKLLKEVYDDLKPDFCLNLHDQRTIFSAGSRPKSAILSFLTPSMDEQRSIDDYRKRSMSIIAGMAEDLSSDLSGNIGRYDDAFNINCAGDTFQNLSTPTILFEAGHFPGDYEREITRKMVYKALISCLYRISKENIDLVDYKKYFELPQNQKLFNDLIIRKAMINGDVRDVAIQFKEVLKNGKIEFVPMIEKILPEINKYAHQEINADRKLLKLSDDSEITENVIVNKIILNDEELEVKYG